MKRSPVLHAAALLLVLLAPWAGPPRAAAAETLPEAIEAARSAYTSDRRAFVAEQLRLTDREGAAFWPLYGQYRAEKEKLGDGLVKLVLEYADAYPDVPEDRARRLLSNYVDLEKKLADQRARFLKKFARILPAAKTLRFAQLENRLDAVLRLQLASTIPMMPETAPRR